MKGMKIEAHQPGIERARNCNLREETRKKTWLLYQK